jgi:hypothetical protein
MGISRVPEMQGDKPAKKKFKSYPIGHFHLDIAEVANRKGQALPVRSNRSHIQVRLR